MKKKWLKNNIKNFCGIVVIDEAYGDFADDNCINFISEFDNVIVIRSLSKSYSLAGLRVGYALACEELVEGMMKVRDSYNVNRLSQIASIEALKSQKYFRECVNKIKVNRQKLLVELENLGFTVVKSQTNFLFVKPPIKIKADKLFVQLQEKKILVRYF